MILLIILIELMIIEMKAMKMMIFESINISPLKLYNILRRIDSKNKFRRLRIRFSDSKT